MVWFPGGAFLTGSASTYDGTELAAREKVVLVFLQYRLGILGFFRWAMNQGRALYLPERGAEGRGTGRGGVARGRDRVKKVAGVVPESVEGLNQIGGYGLTE